MNFAIIGASGNVGRKTIEILEKSKIDFNNLPKLAATIPLPMLETTPPVTNTNFDIKYF